MSEEFVSPGNLIGAKELFLMNRGGGGSVGSTVWPLQVTVTESNASVSPALYDGVMPTIGGVAIDSADTPKLPVVSGDYIFLVSRLNGKREIEVRKSIPDKVSDWSDGTTYAYLALIVTENNVLIAKNRIPQITSEYRVSVDKDGNPQVVFIPVISGVPSVVPKSQ